MQQAYDTYCAMEPQYAGIYGKAKEPLVPVSHQIVNAELELTLDADGHLLDARSVEAEQAATIIPVTESSSGRVGDTTCAHPLCDQIRFLSPLYPAKYESYLTQLHRWELSPYGHPKLSAIVRYVERGTIVEDLAQRGVISLNEKGLPTKEKQVVRWRVETGVESDTPRPAGRTGASSKPLSTTMHPRNPRSPRFAWLPVKRPARQPAPQEDHQPVRQRQADLRQRHPRLYLSGPLHRRFAGCNYELRGIAEDPQRAALVGGDPRRLHQRAHLPVLESAGH